MFSIYMCPKLQITIHVDNEKNQWKFQALCLKVLKLLKFTPETWSMDEFSKEYMLKAC